MRAIKSKTTIFSQWGASAAVARRRQFTELQFFRRFSAYKCIRRFGLRSLEKNYFIVRHLGEFVPCRHDGWCKSRFFFYLRRHRQLSAILLCRMLLILWTNTGHFLSRPTYKPYWSAKNLSNPNIATQLVLLPGGNIQPNPGPEWSRGPLDPTSNPQATPYTPFTPLAAVKLM